MVLAPGEMDELAVGRDAVHHRVALVELLVELAEGRDLGRADEGEVLRPEEHHLPFALVGLVVDRLEGGLGVGTHHGLEVEGRELVANRQHETLRYTVWNVSNICGSPSIASDSQQPGQTRFNSWICGTFSSGRSTRRTSCPRA